MGYDEVVSLVDRVHRVQPDCVDRDLIVTALGALARLSAWCEAQRLVCAQALETLVAVPEQVLAETARVSLRDAERVIQRARTAKTAPGFARALTDGQLSGAHLDHLGHSLRRLNTSQQAALLADSDRLVHIATNTTAEDFARTLRREEQRLAGDDGIARLQHQQRSVRLHTRIDLASGMHHFNMNLDPVTGLKLHNQLRAATETLFHTTTPDNCPTDPTEKQAFLRAHALLHIINGHGTHLNRPEIIVVIDTTTGTTTGNSDGSDNSGDGCGGGGQGPIIDWGLPVEIPNAVLRDLFHRSDTHPIIIGNGTILHAPGELNLQRTTRLANRAQRRALQALYPTCAIPNCTTNYHNCTIHHITWWRHGGHTNLNNLLPLCTKHHHQVHHHNWTLHLDNNRTLTITHPDNTTMTTGPPTRHTPA